jgi:hypothetical protein
VGKCEKIRKLINIYAGEAHKASKVNLNSRFSALSAEFHGHASAMVEEMNAYMRVSLHRRACM